MRRIACVVLAVASVIPVVARQQGDQAVRDVVAKYVDAREARDAAAVAALFTPDADQLVSSGEWRRGRDQVVSGSLASTERTGGKRKIIVDHVRFIGDTVAIADGRYTIRGGDGGDRNMWSTFVMVNTDGTWKIAAIRNMLPAAPAK